ncbi:MAG: hypothetical protein IH991_09445 [Planctomycetes bacterium]|nr:hypothetical protein [Planctomycetota bacterium]
MPTLIGLSQELFHKAPVLPHFPPIEVFPFITHEERAGQSDAATVSPLINTLLGRGGGGDRRAFGSGIDTRRGRSKNG